MTVLCPHKIWCSSSPVSEKRGRLYRSIKFEQENALNLPACSALPRQKLTQFKLGANYSRPSATRDTCSRSFWLNIWTRNNSAAANARLRSDLVQSLSTAQPVYCKCSRSKAKGQGHRVKGNMGFTDIADRIVWPPSLSRDRKWPRVTKCTHSRVVDAWGNLVLTVVFAGALPPTAIKFGGFYETNG